MVVSGYSGEIISLNKPLMNYRHIYHAGSFADVFKHVLLISLIRRLSAKTKPFCYIESHAGIGNYDLHSAAAKKTLEASNGIQKLWSLLLAAPEFLLPIPEAVTDYIEIVRAWNIQHDHASLRFYPGSPVLVQQCLREQDRMVLTELHLQDSGTLKQLFAEDKQVAIHHMDGYHGLKAFLPPSEARGLVFIDPPFENTGEFAQILQHLLLAVHRFSAGVYGVWYPIKSMSEVKHFYRELRASGIRKIICCEFHAPAEGKTLNACGMVVINPPWRWQKTAADTLSWLSKNLSKPAGSYKVDWLVPE